jgi:hypothetical protein
MRGRLVNLKGGGKMSLVPRLSSQQGRRDEEPNKDLARELVEEHSIEGIREIGENLWNEDRRIQIDCLAVLEQVGLLAPELIADYVPDFLRLAFSGDNRLVWAAMINLALVADRKSQEVFEHYGDLVQVIENGSVITQDNGIKILARVASTNAEYNQTIFPFLIEQLQTCRSKSVPQYAESIEVAVTLGNQAQFLAILNQRYDTLSAAQQRRVRRMLKRFASA